CNPWFVATSAFGLCARRGRSPSYPCWLGCVGIVEGIDPHSEARVGIALRCGGALFLAGVLGERRRPAAAACGVAGWRLEVGRAGPEDLVRRVATADDHAAD